MLAEQYIPVLMLFVVALGFGALFTLLGILIGPMQDTEVKKMPFESGLVNEGSQYKRYSVRFYMVALAFLIFDVEIVFFYPWAVKFRELGIHTIRVVNPQDLDGLSGLVIPGGESSVMLKLAMLFNFTDIPNNQTSKVSGIGEGNGAITPAAAAAYGCQDVAIGS